MEVEHLRVNHRIRPVIDDIPEFSCFITSEKQNVSSVAYQIVVSTNEEEFWNSGKVESDQLSFIRYKGKEFRLRKNFV